MKKLRDSLRLIVQVVFTALTNGYIKGFVSGKIYTGELKSVCVPGLNCYSCPGALGACPLGSLQSSFAARDRKFPFYVIGLISLFGVIAGRFVCGFLCPFGLLQELLYKLPFVKKLKEPKCGKILTKLKYVLLVLLVVLLPSVVRDATGLGSSWFCKFVCPAGTLAGVCLSLSNEAIRASLGVLFAVKLVLLVITALLSAAIIRPFCKYLCPLGAIYALFNKISIFKLEVDEGVCTKCKKCVRVCKMGVDITRNANSTECIRCGDCMRACPEKAVNIVALGKKM